jgi:hypothetical protein
MLWGVARRTLKEVKAPIILLPRGGWGGDGIFMLDRFLSMSVENQIVFSHIR